jgi:hypothetical protein
MKLVAGGETGIRTLDTLRYTRFPSVRLQPLGHLSAVLRAFLNLTQLVCYPKTIHPTTSAIEFSVAVPECQPCS